jgi:hypothetical protein
MGCVDSRAEASPSEKVRSRQKRRTDTAPSPTVLRMTASSQSWSGSVKTKRPPATRATAGSATSSGHSPTGKTWLGDTVSFRWAILHVIEETARQGGHADLVREHIDNTSGYLPDRLLPY